MTTTRLETWVLMDVGCSYHYRYIWLLIAFYARYGLHQVSWITHMDEVYDLSTNDN